MKKYFFALFVCVLGLLAAKFLFHVDVEGLAEGFLDFLGNILSGPNR